MLLLLLVPLVLVWTLTLLVEEKPRDPSPGAKEATTASDGEQPTTAASNSTRGARLTVVLVSDTHGRHRELTVPGGDLLVHAGDFTKFGNRRHALDFDDWLGGLPHPHKVVVAGNHDGPGSYGGFANESENGGSPSPPPVSLSELPSILAHANYLQDSGYSFSLSLSPAGRERDGVVVNVWGSPWQPQYPGFETHRAAGPDIAGRWALIPDDTTILVTHTPPRGVMDGDGRGCADLAERIDRLQRGEKETESIVDDGVRAEGRPALRLAAFGHFHEHGVAEDGALTFVNCAVTDDEYVVRYSPRVVALNL